MFPSTTTSNLYYRSSGKIHYDLGEHPSRLSPQKNLLEDPGFEKAFGILGLASSEKFEVQFSTRDIKILQNGGKYSVKKALGRTTEFYRLMTFAAAIFEVAKTASTGATPEDPLAAHIANLTAELAIVEKMAIDSQQAYNKLKEVIADEHRTQNHLRTVLLTRTGEVKELSRQCDSLNAQLRTLQDQLREKTKDSPKTCIDHLDIARRNAANKAFLAAMPEPSATSSKDLKKEVKALNKERKILDKRVTQQETFIQELQEKIRVIEETATTTICGLKKQLQEVHASYEDASYEENLAGTE